MLHTYFRGLYNIFLDGIKKTPFLRILRNTVQLHLSGLIGTANHPDMQKIRIIGFFFQNMLQEQFEVRLLLFTVCTGV
jgi:hypothetical protein